jgi:hypothetical protein
MWQPHFEFNRERNLQPVFFNAGGGRGRFSGRGLWRAAGKAAWRRPELRFSLWPKTG